MSLRDPSAASLSATAQPGAALMLDDAMLDLLCPMHLRLDAAGHVLHAGPTVLKLCAATGQGTVAGKCFLEFFELRRPRQVDTLEELCAHVGTKLHLRLRDAAQTGMKGVVVCAARQGAVQGGAVVNLSFGISVVEAVRRYRLSAADFAATDLAIELLYLVEAKSAAMEASRTLNQRLQGAMIAAEEQAFTDTLTGLKNRRALDHILDRLVDYEIDFTLMHLDLDFFKSVNDTMGHAAGDRVLQHVARILVSETRDDDTVARVGGDEFVLVFHKALPKARIVEISQRIIERLEAPMPVCDEHVRISASIGVVQSTQDVPMDLAQLSENADLALYASKHAGRGAFTFYHEDLRAQGVLRGITSAE